MRFMSFPLFSRCVYANASHSVRQEEGALDHATDNGLRRVYSGRGLTDPAVLPSPPANDIPLSVGEAVGEGSAFPSVPQRCGAERNPQRFNLEISATRENSRKSGRGGIRTPETGFARLTVFKTAQSSCKSCVVRQRVRQSAPMARPVEGGRLRRGSRHPAPLPPGLAPAPRGVLTRPARSVDALLGVTA